MTFSSPYLASRIKSLTIKPALLFVSMSLLSGCEFSETDSDTATETTSPDLTVDLSVPVTAAAGDTLTGISVVVNNIGTATAPGKLDSGSDVGFGTDIYIASSTTPPTSQPVYSANYAEHVLLQGGRANNTTDLAAGASDNYSAQLAVSTIPADTPDGNYYVCAYSDAGELVAESDETNNITCQPLTISSTVVSNFGITAASLCALISPNYDGFSQSIVTALSRSGGHSSTVDFTFSSAESGISGIFDSSSLTGSADATTVLTLTIDSSLATGDYAVSVEASDGTNSYSQDLTLTVLSSTAGLGLSFSVHTASGGGTDNFGHALAVKSDGSVLAWGSNGFGELGNNDFANDSDIPLQVVGPDGSSLLEDIVSVAAGRTHSLALRADGTVWTWGYASHGQLGTGNDGLISGLDPDSNPIGYTPFAVPVCGLVDIVSIAAGDSHSLALDDNGQAFAFGSNTWGMLGDGTTNHANTPVEVKTNASTSFSNVAVIGAGHFHTLAVDTSGNAFAWGRNEYGALGDGNQGVDSLYPVAVVDINDIQLTGITDIDGGYQHSVALNVSGEVFAWGDNYWGQLADSTMDTSAAHDAQTNDVSSSVAALSGNTVIDVDAGADNTLVVTDSGTVLGFGWGVLGQNGDGLATERNYSPVTTDFGSATVDIKAVSALGSVTLVTSENTSGTDATIYTFGDDRYGQLGIGGSSETCTLGTATVTCVKQATEVTGAIDILIP